jgi:predicted small secreted protein
MTTLRKLRYALALLAALGLGPALAACNTIEGAGQDASAAGGAVSDAARETKEAL